MDVAERARTNPAPLPHAGADASLVPADPAAAGGERMVLNLFFEERDDRWFPGDRRIRPLLRRMLLGEPWISGQRRVFLNLCAGLDRLGIRYRINDYGYIRKHPRELACIIGRPFVLDWFAWENPLLLGVAMYNHPVDAPARLNLQTRTILVPCAWYAEMCRPAWPHVEVWPVGIETDLWTPGPAERKSVDVLLYDKVRWEHDRFEAELIEPIRRQLQASGRSVEVIRYGHYKEDDYRAALSRCRSMVFLCEHESQGIACQQALSSGVAVFAWDRGGPWQDPDYFPHRVRYEGGVSSVPYFDARCGMTFTDASDFLSKWSDFWSRVCAGGFAPRDYVLDNLTLEKGALRYYEIAEAVMQRQTR